MSEQAERIQTALDFFKRCEHTMARDYALLILIRTVDDVKREYEECQNPVDESSTLVLFSEQPQPKATP